MNSIVHPFWFRLGGIGALVAILSQAAWPAANAVAVEHARPKPTKAAEEKPKGESPSKVLSFKEMTGLKGRWAGNPYYAGTAKFDKVINGVNLRTGNFTMSATDLSFEGGFGIPVSFSRTFSANQTDEGPLGPGWNLSIDVRSTVGAVSNGSKSPSLSVPASFKERPSMQDDPNLPADPVSAVISVDDSGEATTISKDVDGVLNTPAWDKNNLDPVYETIVVNGEPKQILIGNRCITPDGTVYVYGKQGSYVGGSRPWNNPYAAPELSNVLKVLSATDRHGNTTTYQYAGSPVTYQKSNGTVSENPVTGITMPNGRGMTFAYQGNRMTSVTDGTRTVLFGYDASGRLTGVTSPGGRITRYGWGPTLNDTSVHTLNSITDPRGQVTTLWNRVATEPYHPERLIFCCGIVQPNGIRDWFLGIGPYAPAGETTPFTAGSSPAGLSYVQYKPGAPPVILKMLDWYVYQQGSLIRTGTDGDYTTPFANSGFLTEQNFYSADTHDLLEKVTAVADVPVSKPVEVAPYPDPVRYYKQRVLRTSNFLGNPLREVTTKWTSIRTGYSWQDTNLRTFTKEYAYWEEDKYFQEKAQRVQIGSEWRYSFKDYYNDKLSQGKKGQVWKVYDAKYGQIILDSSLPVPDYAVQGGYAWRYQVTPRTSGTPNYLGKASAIFDYDSYGRVVSVSKLQKVDGSYFPVYVNTSSSYGSNNAPIYGNATAVTEDVGGINRTTQSLEFDVAGRAIKTMDGMGRTFVKTYDGDGNLLQVSRLVGGNTVPLATTTYGTIDGTPENGSPTTVLDEQSGVSQSLTYIQSGPLRGLPLTHTTVDGSVTDIATYSYTPEGYRDAATLQTPNGTTRTKYSGYIELGMAGSSTPAPTRITRQAYVSGTWQDTSEQIQYRYLPDGRIYDATFAKTPQSGQTGYDTYPAQTQARAVYDYDSLGGIASIKYWWETLQGNGTYVQAPIFAADATYGHALGLKDSAGFFGPNGGGFSLQRRENYAYDAQNDFLTQVDYNDGQAGELQDWTYDPAGNRASASANPGSWVYDNLNRIVTSPFGSYTHDLAGSRLTGPGQTLSWDVTNRLTGLNGVTHRYRADGMRVQKVAANGDTYRWHYDAQMPVEETRVVGGQTTIMRNIVGPRGIDIQFDGANAAFPLYDTHGNAKALLARSGSTFTTTAWRQYDVWGSLRTGSALGGASQRYCANLGHVTDDESGLIYMRARFYEPWTGRFVSEDPAFFDRNWYIYARNAPAFFADSSGKIFERAIVGILKFLLGHILMGMTDELVTRLGNLTKYLNHIDELAEMEKLSGVYRYTDLSEDALDVRKEVMAIHKQLKKIRAAQGLVSVGSKFGKGLDKIFGTMTGYSFIISALIDDIDLAPSGAGSLEAIYGN